MDPLTVLSIAAAAVQFVDFGSRIIKRTVDNYKSASDQTIRNEGLATISRDLSSLLQAVESKLGDGDHTTSAIPTKVGETSDDIFRRLCSDCREIQGALDQIFAKLRPRGDNKLILAASSFAVELRKVAAAGEVDKLAERLNQVRQQATIAALCFLLEEAKRNGVDISQFAQQQADIAATLTRVDQTTQKFSVDLASMIRGGPTRGQYDGEMVRYVLSDKWNAGDAVNYGQPEQVTSYSEEKCAEKIIQSLYFYSMGHREAGIPERCARTFEWIYKEPRRSGDGSLLWHSFQEWLKGNSDQIYWITGKPGAGKSTLLKFIAHDERYRHYLTQWARGGQLLTGCYFSWNAGVDILQKTHEGLLKTLLFEILKQDRSLAPRVFSGRWLLMRLFGEEANLPGPQIDELMRAFRALLSETGEALKLALIIDGLDEFEDDHKGLVALLREANKKPGVKICTSSRPWNIFEDEYTNNPTLRVEELTHDDIELYVQGRLQDSPGFQEVRVINPTMATGVIHDIVNKAEGVFLWVSIVSNLLEELFQEGYNPDDLEATIDGLPSEVSQLFTYIWGRTNAKYRDEGSQYFQIRKICEDLVILPSFLTFWLGETAVPLDIRATDITGEYESKAIKSLSRKLMSRTGGLLEIDSHYKECRVEFMHRTAADWVSENWDIITSSTEKDLDVNLRFLKGEVLRAVLMLELGGCLAYERGFSGIIVVLLEMAALVKDTTSNRTILAGILDRLDRQLSKLSEFDPTNLFGDEPERQHRYAGRHWSNREHFSPPHIRRYPLFADNDLNFLAYAARFPIIPYIKFKLEDPNISSRRSLYTGLLENIVLGVPYGSFDWFHLSPDLALSLDLVEHLLQRGICLDQVEKGKEGEGICHGDRHP